MPTPQERFNHIHRRNHDAFMERLRSQHRPPGTEPSGTASSGRVGRGVGIGLALWFAALAVVMLGVCGFVGVVAVRILDSPLLP